LGVIIYSRTRTYPVKIVADYALESTNKVTVTQDNWRVFESVEEIDTGLIFFPGDLV
jgi:hypothetical protein